MELRQNNVLSFRGITILFFSLISVFYNDTFGSVTGEFRIHASPDEIRSRASKYDYSKEEKSEKKKEKEQKIKIDKPKNQTPHKRWVYWVVALLLISVLIGVLLQFVFRRKSEGNESYQPEIRDDLKEIYEPDFDGKLSNAYTDTDPRMALRYMYLNALKALIDKKIILPSPGKTNFQFVEEIENIDIQSEMKVLTEIFEKVWYGYFHITGAQLQHWKNKYDRFTFKVAEI